MKQIHRLAYKFSLITLLPLTLAGFLSISDTAQADLEIYFTNRGKLRSWTQEDLSKLPQREIIEKPNGGPPSRFRGPTLDQIILKTIESLSLDERAQIDLVIIKESQGREISIPRSFITKYPVVYDNGKIAPPIQTRPKSTQEELPIQAYFASNVKAIELTNSKNRFGPVYLKNRSDPAAIRGEKYFVQTCLGCHGSTEHQKSYPTILKQMMNSDKLDSHSKIYAFPVIGEKTMKSLRSYLEAYHQENPQNDP
jgi:mono/diheme cytochrome c family protein